MAKDRSLTFWQKLNDKYPQTLDPIDRASELIFGLIMVLTFTCSISAAESGSQDIELMLWAAIGCNLAWGIVDAIMFLMSRLMERAEKFQLMNNIRLAKEPDEIRQTVKEAMTPMLADLVSSQHINELHQLIVQMPGLPMRSYISRKEWLNAGLIFLLVFISTFPVIIPFFFLKDQPLVATRVSNAVAIGLLFIAGYILGRKTGYPAWLSGLLFTIIGVALVFMTIALGG